MAQGGLGPPSHSSLQPMFTTVDTVFMVYWRTGTTRRTVYTITIL